jgi:hypothetical protein
MTRKYLPLMTPKLVLQAQKRLLDERNCQQIGDNKSVKDPIGFSFLADR